jgi:hypothetical protein
MQVLRTTAALAALATASAGAFNLPPLVPSDTLVSGFLSYRLRGQDFQTDLGSAALVPPNPHTQSANAELGLGLVLTGQDVRRTRFYARHLVPQWNVTQPPTWGFISLEMSYSVPDTNVTRDLCVSYYTEDARAMRYQPIMLLDCTTTRISDDWIWSQQLVVDYSSGMLGVVIPKERPRHASHTTPQSTASSMSPFGIAEFSWTHVGDMDRLLTDSNVLTKPGVLHTAFTAENWTSGGSPPVAYTRLYVMEQWDRLLGSELGRPV